MARRERREMKTGFRWENVTERDRLEDLVANGKMVLTGMLRKCWMCELDTPD